jgi:hypothetical protein
MLCPSVVLVQGRQLVRQNSRPLTHDSINIDGDAAAEVTSSNQQQTDDPRMLLYYSGVASIILDRCFCEFCYLGKWRRGRCLASLQIDQGVD